MNTKLENVFGTLLDIPCSSKPLFTPEDWEKFLDDWREKVLPKMIEDERRLRSCNPPSW